MTPEQLKLLQLATYGFAAALIGSMAKERKLRLPRVYLVKEETGEAIRILDPGFLAAPLLGAFMAMIIDGRLENALLYGLASGYAGPAVLNAFIDPLLHRLRIHPEGSDLHRGSMSGSEPAGRSGEGGGLSVGDPGGNPGGDRSAS
jgi:hypothetical protein